MNLIEIWRWINFLVLAGLIVWLVRKIDVGAMLQKRREHIKAELDQAQKLEQEAAVLKAQAEHELTNAGAKAQEILQDARKMGERVQAEIREMAEAEAKRIHEQAKLEAELEYQNILKELKREALEEAMQRAAEAIKQELTPSDQERLVRDFLNGLDKKVLN
ncbi:F0F1 ATP synthase subunit B [Candidatus Acetothermia bacterium]|nr:F0F1 ATP synthase subunit B [Candidatus Acetothermia bacterium]MBI3461121.1 F0F1 ATP synthase subunit B [Candidatus Acetothermia bacterium]MBI3660119.1 F0F1 ATP synthase subunit B [Candidatus Acetothermia bacterium]